MGKHWTKEERVYFFRHVLPESKCSTRKYSEQGLCFAALAIQMQEDLDALRQSCRTYTEDVLFQHWYQKVWVGTTSNRNSAIYAPSYPGLATTQGRGNSSAPVSPGPATTLLLEERTQLEKKLHQPRLIHLPMRKHSLSLLHHLQQEAHLQARIFPL